MKIMMILSMSLEESGPSIHLINDIILEGLTHGHQIITVERSTKHSSVDLKFSNNKNYTRLIVKNSDINKTSFINRYIAEVNYARQCRKYYKEYRDVDIVFLQSCNNAYYQIKHISRYLKAPIVYNVQDIFPNNLLLLPVLSKRSIIYKILILLQRKAYKQSDSIITISEDMKQTLINDKVPSEKITVIYNWGSYNSLITKTNNEFIQKNNVDINKYNVVYAGNVGRMQNIWIVIKAAALLKNYQYIKFYIIGDGVEKQAIVKYAEENQLNNIFFLPMQNSKSAINIYSMADINLIPLVAGGIYTALPSKTANCLYCRNTIIACIDDQSKFAKLLDKSNNCYVVNSNDSEALANQILKCYENKDVHDTRESNILELFDHKNAYKYIIHMEEVNNEYI